MAILLVTAVGMGDTEGDTEIVARYNAGAAGDPVPDPTSPQGGSWKLRLSSGSARAVSNDLGLDLNAWKITDRSEKRRTGRAYYTSVTDAQIVKANTHGWRLHVRLRMVDDFKDTMSQMVVYDSGPRRWTLFFDLDWKGDLVVTQQHSSGNISHSFTTGGTGKNAYHDFELVYDPATKTADFIADGKLFKRGDAGKSSTFTNKEVVFGTGSSPGQGEANWNLVEFEILGVSADTTGPEGPDLEIPPDNKIMAQLNNPAYPDGFKWQFGWNSAVDLESGIRQYKIVIRQSSNVITEQIVSTTEYIHVSKEMLKEAVLKNWSWQVQAQDDAGNWGEWSQIRNFTVESAYPPAPEIVFPKGTTELKRGHNPECAAGVEWKFDWTDVTHSNGIKQYHFNLKRPGKGKSVQLADEYLTDSEFIYNSCDPLDEDDLKDWKWGVRAQNNAGKWSKWSAETISVAQAPTAPIIIVPELKEELPQQNNPPGDGFVWNFAWEPSTHKSGIEEYHMIIEDSEGKILFDHPLEPGRKDFTFESNKPIKDTKRGFVVMVRARSVDDNWSNWGVVKFTVAPYVPPTPPSNPVLTSPAAGIIPEFPQQNNPNIPMGFVWSFTWQPSTSDTTIKQYRIIVENPNVPEISLDATTTETKFDFASDQKIIDSTKLNGWTVKVQAEDVDGAKSEWSEGQFKAAAYIPTVLPSVPNLLLPVEGKVLPQQNNPTSRAGFVWTFKWEASTSNTPIKGYQIVINNPSVPDFSVDQFVTQPNYIYHHQQGLKEASQLSGWTWKVKALDTDDEWGEWSQARTFSAAAYVPYKPEPPQPGSPSGGEEVGYSLFHGFPCENRLSHIRWTFFWVHPNENEVKDYEILIKRQVETTPILQTSTQSAMRTYEYISCDIIDKERTIGWIWKVRAQSWDDVWSEWSWPAVFRVRPFFPTVPKPKPAGTNNIMPQSNNPNNPDTFIWTFEWEASHHPEYPINKVKKYYLFIGREGESTAFVWKENITALKYTLTSSGPLTDDRLDGWYWQVGASTPYGPSGLCPKQKFTVEPHRPPPPKLLMPESGGVMPQGNNDNCDPAGYYWKFEWEPSSHPTGIKNYKLEVIRPDGTLERSPTITHAYYYISSCRKFDDDKLQGWKWRVKAQSNRGQWSPWSEDQFEVGSYDPSPFELLSPNDGAVLPQNNNPDCADGFSWTFDWEDSEHSSGIAKYHILIKKPDGTRIHRSPTESNYTYSSCTPISDDAAKNWTWSVVVEANNGTHTGCIARKFNVQDIDKPSSPTILYPEENHEFPDGTHYGDSLPDGAWNIVDFQFEASDPSGIKQHRLYIYRKLADGRDDVLLDTMVASTKAQESYRGVITTPIPDDELTGWKVKVKSLDNAGNWSDWSSLRNFSFAPTPPPEEPSPPPPIQWMDTFAGGDPSGDIFKLELDSPGTLTKKHAYVSTDGLNYTVECETDSSSGTITLSRYSFDETPSQWVVMNTLTAEPNKNLILSGLYKTMYQVHVDICAKENANNVVWDSSLPSLIGARIKFYDAQGRELKEKFVDVLAYSTEACNGFDIQYIDGKPEYFTVLIWEDDVGDAHHYNTQRIGDDDDLIWHHEWKHQFWLVENVNLTYTGVEKHPISGNVSKCTSDQMADCYLPIELPDDCFDIIGGNITKSAPEIGYIFRPRGGKPNEKDVHEEEGINISQDEWWLLGNIYFGIYPSKSRWWNHYYEPAYVLLKIGTPEKMGVDKQ